MRAPRRPRARVVPVPSRPNFYAAMLGVRLLCRSPHAASWTRRVSSWPRASHPRPSWPRATSTVPSWRCARRSARLRIGWSRKLTATACGGAVQPRPPRSRTVRIRFAKRRYRAGRCRGRAASSPFLGPLPGQRRHGWADHEPDHAPRRDGHAGRGIRGRGRLGLEGKAKVALARKLAVVLHRMWLDALPKVGPGEVSAEVGPAEVGPGDADQIGVGEVSADEAGACKVGPI